MKEERKEKEDFQGRFFKKEKRKRGLSGKMFQERKEKRKKKKKIGKKQIPILWNQFRGLGFLLCRRNYS
nr:hypothetical protein [uncultured Prevotella sp.]